jgi:hypothetical protein
VAVLTLGGIAFSLGLTGPTVSAASARNKGANVQPIVRTHTKRIVVHRQAPTPPARTVVMPAPSSYSASTTTTTGGYESDDGGFGEDSGGGRDD